MVFKKGSIMHLGLLWRTVPHTNIRFHGFCKATMLQ